MQRPQNCRQQSRHMIVRVFSTRRDPAGGLSDQAGAGQFKHCCTPGSASRRLLSHLACQNTTYLITWKPCFSLYLWQLQSCKLLLLYSCLLVNTWHPSSALQRLVRHHAIGRTSSISCSISINGSCIMRSYSIGSLAHLAQIHCSAATWKGPTWTSQHSRTWC